MNLFTTVTDVKWDSWISAYLMSYIFTYKMALCICSINQIPLKNIYRVLEK